LVPLKSRRVRERERVASVLGRRCGMVIACRFRR